MSCPARYPAFSIACRMSVERRFVRRQVGREAALVADGGGQAPRSCSDALERVEHLRAPAQRLAKASARRPA